MEFSFEDCVETLFLEKVGSVVHFDYYLQKHKSLALSIYIFKKIKPEMKAKHFKK